MKMNKTFKRGRPSEGKMTTPENYELEKIIGKRKPNGELKLKRLRGVHREMIQCHLAGLSNRDIAFLTGHDEITIGRVLRDPLSQVYIQQHHEGMSEELEGLHGDAIDAIRNGLQSGDTNQKLNAAKQFFNVSRRYIKQKEEGKTTAEDVIALALQAISRQGGAIESLADRRKADVSKIIDVTPEIYDGDVSNGHDNAKLDETRPRDVPALVDRCSDG